MLETIVGEIVRIEDRLNNLGDSMQKRFVKSNSDISAGFVTCTLVFCVGSMAIVGSIQSGLVGNMLPAVFIPVIYFLIMSLF